MSDWRNKAVCRDMDHELFFPATQVEERLDYAGEIPGFHEGYIRQAKEMLEIARKAVNE